MRHGKAISDFPAATPRTIKSGAPDPDRIPFGDELLLKTLAPGKYNLVVTISDTISGATVTQTVDFEVV